ncbi:dienelactone hydrolase family protein [Bacillus sp. FJAT-29790]|uniref:dienelactone hydrolase family protein n=1 Tax=Bacillus sp. FJAT-29790 TaxID=1895002 RepID=UPI00349F6852
MIQIHGNSDKLIVVVHEIYGINQHMKDLCKLLLEQNFDVICPNLLEQEIPFDYSQEEEAYRNFMNNLGFTNALNKVKNIILDIQDKYSKIFIIGFSVGATVAWLCSEEEYIDGIVGYYGSRIRDYVKISPKCPALLFFPKVEKSFNINELIATLDKQIIDVHICKGEHGFSDPYSPKYNRELAQNTFKETLNFLKNR